ncbi:pilus assembly protein TadC [Desulfitispora alkaliphila]|uniref:TspO/MBR family protein n=1 Tax=Desulfitispora alkaliphila TaxID=622674 RepID=UPI003D196666
MENKIRLINIGALIAVIVINFLANWLPINNQTTAEVSAKYPALFTPAGYAFSIWGLIYLLLTGFVIYQALPGQEKNKMIISIGYLLAISSVFNVFWIFAWHYDLIGLSLIIMLALLVTLIILYIRINNKKKSIALADKLLVQLPFSIYLGWISVATLANVGSFIYYMNWDTLLISPVIWAIVMIILGTFIAFLNILTKHDTAYALVFVWAFIGIGVRHSSEILILTITAWLAAAAITFLLGWTKYSNHYIDRRY